MKRSNEWQATPRNRASGQDLTGPARVPINHERGCPGHIPSRIPSARAPFTAWVRLHGAVQLARVRRTATRLGKKTVEVVYAITSADVRTASPATLAGWVQGHLGIENRLPWVREVTFDEDRSQVRTGAAPQVMATLRNLYQ